MKLKRIFIIGMLILASIPTHTQGRQSPLIVDKIRWSNDERFVATVTVDNTISIYEVGAAQPAVSVVGFEGIVSALAWSDDDSKLAFGTVEILGSFNYIDTIYIWDMTTETIQQRSPEQEGGITAIVWAQNGARLYSGSEQADGGEIRALDLATNQFILQNDSAALSLSLSPDGQEIAIGKAGGAYQIINSLSFQEIYRQPPGDEESDAAIQVTWNPSGQLIATGHTDGRIRVWERRTGNRIMTLSGGSVIELKSDYSNKMVAVKFDPTGQFLRSINAEGFIRTFDIDTGDIVAEKQLPEPVIAADWNADATMVIYSDETSSEVQLTTAADVTITQNLELTSVCSPAPSTYRTWRIRNLNETPIEFGWTLVGGGLAGQSFGTVPAAEGVQPGEVFLSTPTISGDNELQLSVNGVNQGTVTGITTQCASQTAPPVDLELTSLCSPLVGGYRVWQVSNPNASEKVFTWEVDQSSQQGSGIIAASGVTTFITRPESGDPDVSIYVNSVLQQTTSDDGGQCPYTDFIVQYYPESTTRTDIVEGIIPQLNIINLSEEDVDLSELTIRYYFTKDSNQPLEGYCEWTALPNDCDDVTVTTGTLSTPVTGADSYLEVGFTDGILEAESETLDIIVRANKEDWSDFDQSDDYSFDPNSTDDVWVDWSKVTLYYDNVLVWGAPPQS